MKMLKKVKKGQKHPITWLQYINAKMVCQQLPIQSNSGVATSVNTKFLQLLFRSEVLHKLFIFYFFHKFTISTLHFFSLPNFTKSVKFRIFVSFSWNCQYSVNYFIRIIKFIYLAYIDLEFTQAMFFTRIVKFLWHFC